MSNETNNLHTPWEWDSDVCNYDPEQEAPWLADAKGDPVLRGEIKCDSPEKAAFIVRACNSYAELLKALKSHHEVCERQDPENYIGCSLYDETIAAISKAEGKQS